MDNNDTHKHTPPEVDPDTLWSEDAYASEIESALADVSDFAGDSWGLRESWTNGELHRRAKIAINALTRVLDHTKSVATDTVR
ncbi:hypothetical protein [Mycobacteroides chelonae]|uniref:hypothetical protein n=1 Tax=Mycobacteroides chelonae TaxID=1774 RepID=UPI000994326A|nr:hypothetical protein [Mycobacteroides chelonae]